jgi:outer membrane receptor protein involved in Fe transport
MSSAGLATKPVRLTVASGAGGGLDFVARQGIAMLGKEIELKFEARNLTGRVYKEVQEFGDNRIFFNRYKLGRTFSLSASLKF